MPTSEPTPELDTVYSDPDAESTTWVEVLAAINAAEMFWISTTRRDGRPHVTPLPAMWLDGALHFCTGEDEQKGRNLAADPRCILTTGTDRYLSGLDVVVEGVAERVMDRSVLERLADMWRERLDWPFIAVEGGFRDERVPAAAELPQDQPTAAVFAVVPEKILAFSKGEPFAQTRFRFDS